jgi:hypothetical protein
VLCVVRGESNNRSRLQSESTETTNDRCIATVKACRTAVVGVRVCTHLQPGVSVPSKFLREPTSWSQDASQSFVG